ncbi:homeobox protein six1-like [Stylophora pistillata]|uniref:Homeobox protein SIX2 n=1 Tax=Stylophora pistillata TaxID=50429 RepID=A0A2B4SRQ9_STYPI|nr:homeobox protein six1-like [Stylophora pistillata]PFX32591.1 Homeobox protein SIX2 [Stylophora pistillata]
MKPLFEVASPNNITYWSTRAKRLVHCKKFAEVENLLLGLPNSPEFQENEEINRAKIALAWHKKDVQAVYKLIEEGIFSQGDDLIEIWDEAHEHEAKARTAVQRFRVRKRFPPPRSICPSGFRKKRGIPKETSKALQAWLMQRIKNPYPDTTEKLMLAEQHGITLAQLKTWFANARRRLRDRSLIKCPKKKKKKNISQRRTRQKARKDVAVLERSVSASSLNAAHAQEQPLRFDIADITPQVIWSSIMTDLPGVSLVNGIPQFAAPVVPVNVTVPYQLSWLPAVHPAAFLPVQFSRPPSYNWSGNEVVVEPTGEEYLSESHVT